ncbi:MAG: hypothetical protein P8X42_03335 [Calditrichaceae bacterium]
MNTTERVLIPQKTFDVKNEHDIKNLWANKLLLRLIKLDPERYTQSIEKEKVEIVSNTSWLYSTIYTPEVWTTMDFADSSWQHAGIVYGSENPYAPLGLNPDPIWTANQVVADSALDSLGSNPMGIEEMPNTTLNPEVTIEDSLSADSLSVTAFSDTNAYDSTSIAASTVPAEGDSIVFFRKVFEIDGTPTNGMFIVTADDDYRLYLNGDYIIDDAENSYSVLDSVDYITLEYSLKKGSNILAIDVEDKDLTGKGLKFYGYFEVIPSDVTEAAERQARAERVSVDPQVLHYR